MVKTNDFILRYTNCWEDSDLLLQQINKGANAEYLSIASGGENSLSLLSLDPKRVHIIDINPLQIYLIELKIVITKTR